MKDYYKILGVPRDADEDTLKRAYRKLAKRYHPDVNAGDAKAAERFAQINEAYNTLKDPKARAVYDGAESAAQKPEPGTGKAQGGAAPVHMDVESVHRAFENFFGFDSKGVRVNKQGGNRTKKSPTQAAFDSFFTPGKRK